MIKIECPPAMRLAEAVKNEGSKITGPPGTLDVYNLPLKAQCMNVEGCKGFIFGKDSGKKNRTIMVLGATGAGKSTLVNVLINYILGVTWDDTFRFKLVDEGTAKSQAHSQTSEVTVYKLNHREGFQIDYSLTIVDTPGFGDTRGIEKDRLIISQLQRLFSAKHGVSEIDAICFVAQAPLARLTPTQKFIFDSMLSIFGKDVAENIQILVTFADISCPPVLEAIKESGVPCPKEEDGLPIHFKFNNSFFLGNKVPGANNNGGDISDFKEQFDKMYWAMGNNSMKTLFSALNTIKTKSLTLTKEVLRQRAQLEISIENLQIKSKLGLTKLEEIKQETEILKKLKIEITSNKGFEYEVKVTKLFKVKAKELSLNCKTCNVTCHKSCKVQFGAAYYCEVFNWLGKCHECESKCPVSAHVREGFYWGSETVTEKRTFKELNEKYEKASKAAMSMKDIIKQMELEYARLHEEVVMLVERSAQCLNTLKEIALKPDPLTTPEYIELLIESEKSEANPGYLQRVNELLHLKNNAITKGIVASRTMAGLTSERPEPPPRPHRYLPLRKT